MQRTYEVSETEVGFFIASPPVRTIVYNDVFRWVHIPGLPVEQLQFWRLKVSPSPNEWREHVVVMSHYPLLSSETCGMIAGLLRGRHPGAALVFMRSFSEGQCEVRSESDPAEVAAAAAEVKRAGTLDDVDEVRVVVGPRAFDVRVRWVVDRTEAHVTEAAG